MSNEDVLTLANTRFEITPIRSEDNKALLPRKLNLLPSGAQIAITCSEALGPDMTLQAAERVGSMGYVPIPHIPARLVNDKKQLKHIVTRLNGLGVRDIFIPGGDMSVPKGEFSSALDLLMALQELTNRPAHIGIAAHPQGHPFISEKELLVALLAKQRYADYMVTQITGSSKAIERWIERVRRIGVYLPVYAGVIGCVERERLMKTASRFPLDKVMWFVSKNPHIALRTLLTGVYAPGRILRQVVSLDSVAGVHFNTFNRVEDTEMWRRKFISSLSN